MCRDIIFDFARVKHVDVIPARAMAILFAGFGLCGLGAS
jgi:hypothetical protein